MMNDNDSIYVNVVLCKKHILCCLQKNNIYK